MNQHVVASVPILLLEMLPPLPYPNLEKGLHVQT